MTMIDAWRLPRTQIELHAEHLAVRLLLARPQLIDRCVGEISPRALRRRRRRREVDFVLDCDDGSDQNSVLSMLGRAQLELAQKLKRGAITLMNKRLAPIVNLLRLNDCERELLRIFSMALENTLLADVLGEVQGLGRHAMMALLSKVLTHDRALLFGTLREGTLVRMGLLSAFELQISAETLLGSLLQACSEPSTQPETMLKHVLSRAPAPRCELSDFSHLSLPPKAVTRFLSAARDQRRGVHVLLHGDTGTGKTEYSRAIAADLGWSLFEVPVEDRDQSAQDGRQRVAQFALSQRILERTSDAILAFDEAEDLFPDPHFSWFLSTKDALSKGWINRLLEETSVPTLWMANQVSQIDPAILRRFDLIIEVKAMPIAKRRALIDDRFGSLPVSKSWRDRLAAFGDIVPAEVERLARVAATVDHADLRSTELLLDQAMIGSRRAMGMPVRPRTRPSNPIYRPEWTNASDDLDQLAQRLVKHPARLCLYGPPGTGKSAFAHYLSHYGELPLIAKRASDLVDCYIGNTEKNIAAAFEEARDQGAILLIDEADSFLGDRQRAQRSWEISHINELLAQMEDFEGLLVMTTNLFENLDPAVLRRFDLKIKFDYLRNDQRSGLLQAFIEELALHSNPLEQQAAESRLSRLDRLTPGDYAVVARQARINGGMSVTEFSRRLAAEQALKHGAVARPVGFV